MTTWQRWQLPQGHEKLDYLRHNYLGRGKRVIPCWPLDPALHRYCTCPNGAACPQPGHPFFALDYATTDPDTVTAWHEQHPDVPWAMVGDLDGKTIVVGIMQHTYRWTTSGSGGDGGADTGADAADDAGDEIEWTTPGQRANRPMMEWRLQDLMPKVGVGVVFGPTFVGKSLLVIDLALSIANCATSWMGFPIVCDAEGPGARSHAGIILMEGVAGFRGREQAWLKAHPGTTNRGLLTLEYQWVNLADERYVNRFIEATTQAKLDDGTLFAPALIAIDTQGLATDADENDRTQVRRVYRLAKRLAGELSCVVVLVTHPGHQNLHRPAGASSQEQDADFVIRVSEDEVYVKKVKEGAGGMRRMFRLESLDGSVYVEHLGTIGAQVVELAHKSAAYDRRLLCAVKRLQGTCGVSKNALFADVGGHRATFDDALDVLQVNEQVRNLGTARRWRLWCDLDIDCTDGVDET